MPLKRIVQATLIATLFLNGCENKDDLTLPVKVSFKFGISDNQYETSEYLEFTGCRIGVQRIGFEGNREAGGDIHFVTDPSLNLQTLTFNELPVTVSTFDIPQGIYYYMKWDISLKCVDTNGLNDGRDESYPCVGIIFTGNYRTIGGTVVPFALEIDKPEIFRIMSYDTAGDQTIILSVDKEYEAVVWFTPDFAFSAISRQTLEEAEISNDNNNPVIIISSMVNDELYQILLYRIFLSASVTVK